MEQSKRQRLEAKGWKVTTVETLLDLTPEDVAVIEARLAEEASGTSKQQLYIPEEPDSTSEPRTRELIAT